MRRKEAKPEKVDDSIPTNGGTITVADSPFTPDDGPIKTVTFGGGGGANGGGSGGASGGGSGGGTASAPLFDFGAGAGFDGGSRLPDQPDDVAYAGSTGSIMNTGKGPGGFGSFDNKGDKGGTDSGRGPAGDGEIDVIGDGGLRVLLARASLAHMRHSSTLRKSIDFDRLARSQGISPKPASVQPAGPN